MNDHLHKIVAQGFERTKTRVALGKRRPRSLETNVRPDPREDLIELKGLGDVVDATHVKCTNLGDRVG